MFTLVKSARIVVDTKSAEGSAGKPEADLERQTTARRDGFKSADLEPGSRVPLHDTKPGARGPGDQLKKPRLFTRKAF